MPRPGLEPQAHLVRHDRCANAVCVNEAHQGLFTTLVLRNHVKPMLLVLCAPCADVLMGSFG